MLGRIKKNEMMNRYQLVSDPYNAVWRILDTQEAKLLQDYYDGFDAEDGTTDRVLSKLNTEPTGPPIGSSGTVGDNASEK